MNFKPFTDTTKIVAIKTTGNVYSGDVVEELNRKQNYWFDLLTDAPFKAEEIIVLQDPMDFRNRIVNNFDYKKKHIDFTLEEDNDHKEQGPHIEMSGLGKRVLDEVQKNQKDIEHKDELMKRIKTRKVINPDDILTVQKFLDERDELADWKHNNMSTGQMALSVTSTYIDLKTTDGQRKLTRLEMLSLIWSEVKTFHLKSYIQITTNMGPLNIVLYSDKAARTCYSFLELIYNKSLNGCKFSRLVEGTILQLLSSPSTLSLDFVDKSEKLLHDKGGLLTVNIEGEAQSFGITLSAATQLDTFYSVFGEIVGGFDIIKTVAEGGEIDETPNQILAIEDIEVFSDPFQQVCHKRRRKLLGIDELQEKKLAKEVKEKQNREYLERILN